MNKQMGRPEINAIVGMTVSEAIKHLREHNLTLRTTIQDGKSLMVTADIDMKRVNVIVENDKVVDIDKIG
jgi:hypothetical protein